MQWFRIYRDLVDCQKAQSLPAPLFRALINIWCLADHKTGVLPPVAQIAFRLRCPEKVATQWVEALSVAGLLDMTEDGEIIPHNWRARRYVSDNASARVAKHREKRKQKQPCNVTDAVNANDIASVVCSVSVSGSGGVVGGGVFSAEWPEVAAAIRGYFPAADDGLVMSVVQLAAQEFSSVLNGDAKVKLTDSVLAEAVHEAHFQKQTSAGAFRIGVPRCVKTWAEEIKKRGN